MPIYVHWPSGMEVCDPNAACRLFADGTPASQRRDMVLLLGQMGEWRCLCSGQDKVTHGSDGPTVAWNGSDGCWPYNDLLSFQLS